MSRRLLVIVALVACSGGGPPKDPVDLMIVSESTRLRLGDPLPAASPFFDGTTVRVTAARGETIGLQVLYRGERTVAVTAPTGVATRRAAIEPVIVQRASTSLWGPSRGAGAYPDRLRALGRANAPVAGPVLVELAVAADAPIGDAPGTITVGDRALPLVVTVVAVTLPSLGAAPRVWAYYDAREIGAGGREAERACAAMFRAHGVMATPELTLESYDDRKDAVAGSPYVPVLLPDADPALGEAVRGWAARLAGTGQVGFAIPIDEPREEARKREVRALADRVRAAGGGPGKFLYAVTDAPHPIYGDAIDVYISPFAVAREGARAPERWTYNGTPPWAGAMTVDAGGVDLRTWGWIAWRWRVPLWYVWDALYWHDRHNRKRRKEPPLDGPPVGAGDAVTFDDGEDHGNLDGVLALPPGAGEAAMGCVPTLRMATLRRGLQDRLLLDQLEACKGRAAAEVIAAKLVPVALADAKAGARAAWPSDEAAWEAARLELLRALASCSP